MFSSLKILFLSEPIKSTRMINADGRVMTPCGVATMTAGLVSTSHKFVVVDFLSTPMIHTWLQLFD